MIAPAATRDHVSQLRRLDLGTDRPTLAMRSREGKFVEVFKWRDGTLTAAHASPDVLAMWDRYAAVCDYVPLHELPEAHDIFAQFKPIDVPG